MAALTHIRSRAWLEQMVARATRVDPHAGDYADQNALVFHPDDPLFARFRHSIETEQGIIAKCIKAPSQSHLPGWLVDENAILKRHIGNKPRAQMKVRELEAAISWLERNRLADHKALLDGDPRYVWTIRQRRDWTPPVGRADGRPHGARRPKDEDRNGTKP